MELLGVHSHVQWICSPVFVFVVDRLPVLAREREKYGRAAALEVCCSKMRPVILPQERMHACETAAYSSNSWLVFYSV
jgi:hypothetical protein